MKNYALAGAVATLFALAGPAVAAQECRTAALPDGTPAMFCKDKKGNWKQQEGKVETAPVAAANGAATPLYADAVYQGPALYKVPIQQRQRRNRNLTDLILNGTAPTTRDEELFVTINMRIEGEKISGTSSGGTWRNVPFTGTRRNGICNFTGSVNNQTVVTVGKCDANGISGELTSYNPNGVTLKGTFNYRAVTFTDTSARDARRAELKAKCDAGSSTACVELDQLK